MKGQSKVEKASHLCSLFQRNEASVVLHQEAWQHPVQSSQRLDDGVKRLLRCTVLISSMRRVTSKSPASCMLEDWLALQCSSYTFGASLPTEKNESESVTNQIDQMGAEKNSLGESSSNLVSFTGTRSNYAASTLKDVDHKKSRVGAKAGSVCLSSHKRVRLPQLLVLRHSIIAGYF